MTHRGPVSHLAPAEGIYLLGALAFCMPVCLYAENGGEDMEDEIRVIARMDRKKKIRLFHVLLDEERTFSAWLREQVDAYIAEKEPKGKRRKGKEA